MSARVPATYVPDEDEDLSSALISALSEAKDRDVSKDECVLYDNIDPDALDVLFRKREGGDTVKVEFATHDAIVVLWREDGVCIEVQDLEDEPDGG